MPETVSHVLCDAIAALAREINCTEALNQIVKGRTMLARGHAPRDPDTGKTPKTYAIGDPDWPFPYGKYKGIRSATLRMTTSNINGVGTRSSRTSRPASRAELERREAERKAKREPATEEMFDEVPF